MHFDENAQRSFWTKFRANTRQLIKDNERLIAEHVEWLKVMQGLTEEKEMIKKLARNQAEELKGLYEEKGGLEQRLSAAMTELTLLRSGVVSNPHALKAVTIVKINEPSGEDMETYSPAIISLDPTAKTVLEVKLLSDTNYEYALNQAKIEFMGIFDPAKAEDMN